MNHHSRIYSMCCCGLMAALLCVLAPHSITIGLVPVTLATLIIYISIWVLGTKGALISTGIYLLLGLVGLPVFAGFIGGPGKLVGPTGGYLVGYLLLPLIAGPILEKTRAHLLWTICGMIAATAVLYLFGTIWFVWQQQCDWGYALGICVYPFIITDLGKIAVSAILGLPVRTALRKSGLLPRI